MDDSLVKEFAKFISFYEKKKKKKSHQSMS